MGLLGMAGALIDGLTALNQAVDVIRGAALAPEARRQLAGTRLHQAIDEIAKSYEAIEAQLVALLGADVTSAQGRSVLVALEGGSARVHLANMRGHCSSIRTIWHEDLDRLFLELTDPSRHQVIAHAFAQLDTLDGSLLRVASILGEGIANEAAALLDHVDGGRPDDAHRRLLDIRGEVRDLRREINKTLADMVELRFVLRTKGT